MSPDQPDEASNMMQRRKGQTHPALTKKRGVKLMGLYPTGLEAGNAANIGATIYQAKDVNT